MHPAELLQGVFRPEVVPIIEMRPKVSHGRDYQDGVVRRAMGGGRQPRHCQANLAKPQTELQAEDGLDDVGLFWGEE